MNAGFLEREWNARRGVCPSSRFLSKKESFRSVPILGDVAAGTPIPAIESNSDFIELPGNLAKNDNSFALNVSGDSMINDGIFDGDTVICDSSINPSTGDTVVAIVEEEATVKKYYPKKNSVELHPANDNLSPIIVKGGEFRIAGVVTGLIRSIR